jgi:hypothetical protein
MPLKNTKKSLKKRHGIRREISGSDSWDSCVPNNFPLLSDSGAVYSSVVSEVNNEYQIVAQDGTIYEIADTEYSKPTENQCVSLY